MIVVPGCIGPIHSSDWSMNFTDLIDLLQQTQLLVADVRVAHNKYCHLLLILYIHNKKIHIIIHNHVRSLVEL